VQCHVITRSPQIIAAVGAGLCGLCYAEMASMFPVAGSAYAYAYAAIGEFWAWMIGWVRGHDVTL
jgi:APA family basic amino acid/polyamine antiporter